MQRAVVAALIVALFGLACAEADGPEAQVRRLLAEIEQAAEEGDLSALRASVSERYQDESGHDKRALMQFLTFQVMRRGNRNAVVRIEEVALRSDARAEVSLTAGLAGTDAAGGGLAGVRADVYHVDLDVERESDGDWRLVWAQWWPTNPADLL